MDTNKWTTRLRKVPHKVFDHPLSGAYGLWLGMANVAVTSAANGHYDMIAVGAASAAGALGVVLTAGRKLCIKRDVLGKTLRSVESRKKSVRVEEPHKRAVAMAFDQLYALDSLGATRGLVRALPVLLKTTGNPTPWGSSVPEASQRTPDWLANELVHGALYFAMHDPKLLSGKLSKRVQVFIVKHHPSWVAECPHHFSFPLLNQWRPGLIDVALSVYGLHQDAHLRRDAVQAWLETQRTPAPSHTVPTA